MNILGLATNKDVDKKLQKLRDETARLYVAKATPTPIPAPQPVPDPTTHPVPVPSTNPNPFVGAVQYVDPTSQAMNWIKTSDPAHTEDIRLMHKVADNPQGSWIMPEFDPQLDSKLEAAKGQLLLENFYGMINRDNGGYSGGGCADENHYRAWIDGLAAKIKAHPGTKSVVNVEPDALDFTIGGPEEKNAVRYALLKYALNTLTAAGATTYLAVGWTAADQVANVIHQYFSDAQFHGFCLDTSGYDRQADLEAKAQALFQATGKPSIIDTSRNGNGPWDWQKDNPGKSYDEVKPWCNPPGRALGYKPSVVVGNPAIDAYVWAKRVGESDGPLRGPNAGVFMPDYALELARNSKV
jgi:endoglucanase